MDDINFVSVVVPSFRRPQGLSRCLKGLALSGRKPDEVIVSVRRGDDATEAVVQASDGAKIAWVDEPGVLAAMHRGVERACGDVIVFLDDDAVPHADWLERILREFGEPDVGGVGGRDIVTEPDDLPRKNTAGKFTFWGSMVGNHHVVEGVPREVDVLKGANMAFRRQALALPVSLLGDGAQAHFEVATGLWARRAGWRLVLVPEAQVTHLPELRFDADARDKPSGGARYRLAYNYNWCLLSYRPALAPLRLAYGWLIGDRAMPGLVRSAVAVARREPGVARYLFPSVAGQLVGAARALLVQPVPMRVWGSEITDRGEPRWSTDSLSRIG